ncbi:ankyrin repeat-containing domain protein, partial [Amanita rubescens]
GDNSVTPLAAASWRGHLDIVKLLLHEGANPNAISPQNRTPLFYLTKRSPARNRLGIVRALLDAGANVNECYPENNLNTPLMNAITVVADKEVVHELLKRGASLTATNAQGQTAKMLAGGTKLEADFMKWTERTPSELETRLVEFMVSLLVLIFTYTNNEFI